MATYYKQIETNRFFDKSDDLVGQNRIEKTLSKQKTPGKQYVLIMADNIELIFGLSKNELNVLLALSLKMDFEGNNIVDISASIRKYLCDILNLKKGTLRNILSSLRKKGFLINIEESTEKVDPSILYRGPVQRNESEISNFRELRKRNILDSDL